MVAGEELSSDGMGIDARYADIIIDKVFNFTSDVVPLPWGPPLAHLTRASRLMTRSAYLATDEQGSNTISIGVSGHRALIYGIRDRKETYCWITEKVHEEHPVTRLIVRPSRSDTMYTQVGSNEDGHESIHSLHRVGSREGLLIISAMHNLLRVHDPEPSIRSTIPLTQYDLPKVAPAPNDLI